MKILLIEFPYYGNIDLDHSSYDLNSGDTVIGFQDCLNQLVEAGHSVIVIEHHLDMIKVADHIIDMGPEGGYYGGEVVVSGTPEEVARTEGSLTGKFLREVLFLNEEVK
jgi:excinuclease UvrABC ATPase subunit